MSGPTERFTETVQDYIKYRPGYPAEIIPFLAEKCQLTPDKLIADIGCGPGALAKLFLDYGNIVFGVEPNAAMRAGGEQQLANYPNFHSIVGSAESTNLPENNFDFITAGTAFHWFNLPKTQLEFQRIARENAWVILIWNVRNKEESAFLQAYEDLLLEYGKDYRNSKAQVFNQVKLDHFFQKPPKLHSFVNKQMFDWSGLQGRLLSTSYTLRPGDERYSEMMQVLKKIFTNYATNDRVEFLYKTQLYYGRLPAREFPK